MTTQKWTPGPWAVSGARRRENLRQTLAVIRSDGAGVSYVPYSDRTDADHIQSHADARLIAAAPEMYEALLNLVSHTEACELELDKFHGLGEDAGSGSSIIVCKARTILAKARGDA